MEYHYFTIEDIEMLTFNGIPHLHNHLNYLIHTDKDQKFTNEDSVRNVSFIFDNEGNSKALRWTDDLEKRIELKKYVFRYIRDLYKRLFYARVGYDWLICNKDGRIFFADHGLYPLEKGDKVWNNNEIDGYSVSAFVEDKKKRYKSLVSWEDEQPFDIYEFLLTQDIEM